MAKKAIEYSEPTKQPEPQSIGAMEAAFEGIKAIAPGLSFDKIIGDVSETLSHLGKQGAHELAAAMFTGSAFVMYPHANQGVEDPQHGLTEKPKEVEQEMEL